MFMVIVKNNLDYIVESGSVGYPVSNNVGIKRCTRWKTSQFLALGRWGTRLPYQQHGQVKP